MSRFRSSVFIISAGSKAINMVWRCLSTYDRRFQWISAGFCTNKRQYRVRYITNSYLSYSPALNSTDFGATVHRRTLGNDFSAVYVTDFYNLGPSWCISFWKLHWIVILRRLLELYTCSALSRWMVSALHRLWYLSNIIVHAHHKHNIQVSLHVRCVDLNVLQINVVLPTCLHSYICCTSLF